MSQQRNAKCACGSGKKFKRCCLSSGMSQNGPRLSRCNNAELERDINRELLPMLLVVAVASLSVR
jgi:hypothetical protein